MTRATRTDPRVFHHSQAIPASYMGLAPETGPSGYMTRLEGIPAHWLSFDIPADTTTPQVLGDLPPNVLPMPYLIRHAVNSAGTMKLALAARSPDSELVLVSAADLTAVITSIGALTFSGANILTQSRQLYATVTSGAASERVKFSLQVLVMPNGWF